MFAASDDLMAFDIKLKKKPERMDSDKEGFWGWYQLSFKVLSLNKWQDLQEKDDTTTNNMSRQVIPFNRGFKRKFTVDISRHEYVKDRELKLLDDYYIYVYSPRMILLEKLRAICQPTEEYTEIIETHKPRGRAQDFFDIYVILESFPEIRITSLKSIRDLKEVFKIKKVPHLKYPTYFLIPALFLHFLPFPTNLHLHYFLPALNPPPKTSYNIDFK